MHFYSLFLVFYSLYGPNILPRPTFIHIEIVFLRNFSLDYSDTSDETNFILHEPNIEGINEAVLDEERIGFRSVA